MRTPALLLLGLVVFAGCETAPTPITPYRTATPDAAAATTNAPLGLKPADDFEAALLKPPVKIEAVAEYARKLSHLGDLEDNPERARDLRRRAYAFATAAKKAGSEDLLLPLLLAETRPDGTLVPKVHSDNPAVNQALTEGEAKFGRGDFDGALACYKKALELDPNNYRAALFAGDVFFSKQDVAAAVPWFDRAIAIDPTKETAHRYRADALTRLGRSAEAGQGYISAFVCAPFAPIPTKAFNSWIASQGLQLNRPDPHFPSASLRVQNGKYTVALDPKHNDALNLSYAVARVFYANSHHIPPADYRLSLDEELFALHDMLDIAAELQKKEPNDTLLKTYAAQLDLLVQLERAGLLPAFVFFERPSEGLFKDYPAYVAQHRELLVRYINTVWLQKS